MKKTIILSAIALVFTLAPLHANSENFETPSIVKIEKASPFHLSIVKGDIETVKKLIELGTDVNEKWNGMTPAMYAARYNKVEILKLLVSKGANLKARSKDGHTAIHYAKISNAKDAMQYLKKALGKKR